MPVFLSRLASVGPKFASISELIISSDWKRNISQTAYILSKKKMSNFSHLQVAPVIEVFHVNKCCVDDPSPTKVNLSIGAYRDGNEKPWVLPVVREAEKRLANDASQNHEYLPVLGFEPFSKEATRLLLGDDCAAVKDGRVAGVQCLSGTGSLRVGAEFLTRILGRKTYLMSSPTWENHKLVFKNAGFTDAREYRYWDQNARKIDFDGFIADLENAPDQAVVLLHACAHNPTGMDPTQEQWKKICTVIKKKGLFPFFDIAYQGFASGDTDKDAWPVRYFVKEGLEMVVAQSFAKNFGLYNERIGHLAVVVSDVGTLPAIRSEISLLVRSNYSNPPNHGAKVVHMVLSNEDLKKQWFEHIKTMANRIGSMRKQLRDNLEKMKTPGTWSHITEQIGMFSYTGLNEKQVEMLAKKHHVYLLKSGRISVAGINEKNVEYVAKAFHDVITSPASHV